MHKAMGALMIAEGAIVVDTTNLSIEEVYEKLNKIMSHYTHDYVDFEYNEEDDEWNGNIF